MYRIDNSTSTPTLAAPNPPGPQPDAYWTGGNPASGLQATLVDPEFLNMVQEEIVNCVNNEGQLDPILAKNLRNQLLMAIRREVQAAGGAGPGAPPPLPTLNYVTSTCAQASAVPAPSMAMTTATSITLASGNWEVWGSTGFAVDNSSNGLVMYELGAAIGVGQNTDWVNGDTGLSTQLPIKAPYPAYGNVQYAEFYAGHAVINLTASTIVYLMGRPNFAGTGSVSVYGFLAATQL